MKVDEIRNKYLKFFESKKHRLMSSDSLVPQNDPTLLFTGAGMNQFKDYFLGLRKDMQRATTSQKCLRTGDLEEVGKTAYHHSFFEMLGNFSFGDYFKKEAIQWAWEFLTEELKISKEKLRVTVHKTDEEAYSIWINEIGLPKDRVYQEGDKSNYWPSNAPQDGPNGPCGPCSEIYYDMSDTPNAPAENVESKRFAEIWNLVFTQFDRCDGGRLTPLANRNIDTGMGLERLACVLQGKKSNFEIDSFEAIHKEIKKQLNIKEFSKNQISRRNAIADHTRAVVFCIQDGVIPSNEGRGYVVRKLIRRALWHAHQLCEKNTQLKPFMYKVVDGVVLSMKSAYPELQASSESIAMTIRAEEERFLATLDTGLQILTQKLDMLKKNKDKVLPGTDAFELYDTYGFPEELTRLISEDHGFSVDDDGFDKEMQKQRDRAKKASQISGSIFVTDELEKNILALPESKYCGYSDNVIKAKILLSEIKEGKGIVLLDKTPFYGESGGQVGDRGTLITAKARLNVVDTQKNGNHILHTVEVQQGIVEVGETVEAKIDLDRRNKIMRNHTSTHLLHSALRKLLGTTVRQLGSLVNQDKLRFDYSYGEALSLKQVEHLENDVNEQIRKDIKLDKYEKNLEEAKKEGAIAFFGEKYGEKVRIVNIGDYSKEFCGGVHCHSTGEIGCFVIVSDSSIASGTRRIEALSGDAALAFMQSQRAILTEAAGLLKAKDIELKDKIVKLQERVKALEKEKKNSVSNLVDPKKILEDASEVGSFKFAHHLFGQDADMQDLRKISDAIRSMSQRTLFFLGTENADKINFLVGVSPDLKDGLLDVREVMQSANDVLGGTGGGRKDLVQGGAKNTGQYKSWKNISDKFTTFLKERS
jgi:alanyl-tRNA synthetase